MARSAARLVCLAAVVAFAAGCAKQQAKLAQLSGKVTFNGKPVPAGYITFMPDSAKGNVGQLRSARITDGAYDTAQAADSGLSPGPTIIRITGFDGKPLKFFPDGKQIFNPYEVYDTVPEGAATKDFAVPVSAANNLKIEPTADVP